MRGFTLIELIVALAVAGAMLVAVPTAIYRGHEAAEYRATVRQVLAGLKAARHTAMRDGIATAFSVDERERKFGSGYAPSHFAGGTVAIRALVSTQDVTRNGISQIWFYPDGSATGGSVDIVRPSGDGVRLRVDWMLGKVAQYSLQAGEVR